MAEGLSKKLSFPEHFVIKPKGIAYDDDRYVGLSVVQVYEHEYKTTFQVQKNSNFA